MSHVPKFFGFSIFASRAINTPTASNANRTVPKYNGYDSIGPIAGIVDNSGKSWNT